MSGMENGSAGTGSPHPMDYCGDAAHADDTDNEAELRVRDWMGDRPPRANAHQEPRDRPAREPAPGAANPLSGPEGRPLDRRERAP